MALRSPLSVARGLGSAKDGTGHWWAQRVTAVALVPLTLWLVLGMAGHAAADYESARQWVGSPVTAVLLVLTLAAAFHHAQLGLQVILEDYVHHEGLKLASILVAKAAAVVLAAASIFAVLAVALGG